MYLFVIFSAVFSLLVESILSNSKTKAQVLPQFSSYSSRMHSCANHCVSRILRAKETNYDDSEQYSSFDDMIDGNDGQFKSDLKVETSLS